MPSPTDLIGKIAFVTGGSNGIGAAAVRRLADAGASVVIGYKSGEARAKALMADLPTADHSVQPLSVEDSSSIEQAAKAITARYSRLDILVNSAGFTRPVPHADLDALDDALIDAIMAVNVRGPFGLIRALAKLMKQGGGGVIVNVSSIAGFTGLGSNIAYGASKAALDTMTMSLARVLAPEIRVLSVSPGAVATDFVAGRDRAALEKLAQSTPLKRVIEPDEVAAAIMACITHLTATTGTRIIVDGGRFL